MGTNGATVDSNYLQQVFQRVDKDRSGAIDAAELQSALSNGNWTPFNPETVRLMIGMFDTNKTQTIDFASFGHLWKYVTDWQVTFRSFDKSNTNCIDRAELKDALTAFGYRFSEPFFDVLMRKFDRSKKGAIYFDDFIQCCIVLHMLTQAFAGADTNRTGTIHVSYEQFLSMIFSTNL